MSEPTANSAEGPTSDALKAIAGGRNAALLHAGLTLAALWLNGGMEAETWCDSWSAYLAVAMTVIGAAGFHVFHRMGPYACYASMAWTAVAWTAGWVSLVILFPGVVLILVIIRGHVHLERVLAAVRRQRSLAAAEGRGC